MTAAATTQPHDTAPMPPSNDSVVPGMRGPGVDYAALWRQVEAEAARVVVVDLQRKVIVAGRSMAGAGEATTRLPGEATLERFFPGATAQVEQWASETQDDAGPPSLPAHTSGGDSGPASTNTGAGEMCTHSLSPRQWVYFWRINHQTALLALVQHRYGRGAIAAGDMATVRLLCEHWLAPELQAMGIGRAAQAPWNRVERRARASAPRELWMALAGLGLAGACGLWLLLAPPGASPATASGARAAVASGETQRLARLADETLARSLAASLASRDYGEVQEALAAHLNLGHFGAAVILNERKLVVAHAGLTAPPAIGQRLPDAMADGARELPLRWAGNALGTLLALPDKPDAARGTSAGPAGAAAAAKPGVAQGAGESGRLALRLVGAVLALGGIASGALLWRHLRARYR